MVNLTPDQLLNMVGSLYAELKVTAEENVRLRAELARLLATKMDGAPSQTT